jgi:hypothetical protein
MDPANELLPWYLNGSLEPEDAARVRDHLSACAICGREIDVLSLVAREVGEHDLALLDPSEPAVPPVREARGRAGVWPVAAALAVLLALAAWWGVRTFDARPGGGGSAVSAPPAERALPAGRTARTPGPGQAPGSHTLEMAMAWDLTTPRRGDAPEAAFPPPPAEAAVVTLRVTAPVAPDSTFEVELRCPDGSVLTGRPGRLMLDPLARAAYALPASTLRTEGRYEMVLREFPEGGSAPREYLFRFHVSPAGAE